MRVLRCRWAGAALLLVALSAAQAPRRLIYGGDSSFAPYEYLDSQGQAQGFNVELVRALAREAGMEVEVRMMSRTEVLRQLAAGQIDLAIFAYSEKRAERFVFGPETWTLRQALLFPGGRQNPPGSVFNIAAETVAIEEGSLLHEFLLSLPPAQRPQLKAASNQDEILRLVASGEATAAAGNGLALQTAARRLGLGAMTVLPVKSQACRLVARQGGERAMEDLSEALARLKERGAFAELVEQHLSASPNEGHWREVIAGLAAMAALAIAAFLWARSLRWQVQSRTAELRASQQAYEALVNSVDGIVWEADAATFRFTFVSQQAERLLGYPRREWLAPGFWQEHLHPEDRDAAIVFCASQTAERKDHELDYRMLAADGRVLWIHDIVTVVVETGRPAKLRGIMVDITERRRAEEALRESENKFRNLAETVSASLFIYRGDHFLYANRAALDILGYTFEELQRLTVWDTIHPDMRDMVRERGWARQRGEAVPDRYELRILTKKGRSRWVETAPVIIPYEGAPAVLITAVDITERKLAEEAVRESEAKFRTLAESVSTEILIIQDGRVRYANPSLIERSGFSLEELTAMAPGDNIAPEYRDLVRQRLAERLAGDPAPGHLELMALAKDGRVRWVDTTSRVIQYEGRPALLVAGMDITELKQALEALRLSQERLQFALEGTDDGYWDWNVETGEVYCSPRMAGMLGFAPEEIGGRPENWEALIHPDDLVAARRLLREHMKGNTPFYEAEYRARTKSGEYKWILDRGKVVARHANGRAARAAGTHKDITDRRQLEEQLAQAQKMEAIGQLAGGVAHDFNNLLTVIKGYSTILAGQTGENTPQGKAAREIDAAADRAAMLTRQLLAFSRRQMLQPTVLDLNHVLRDLHTILSRLLGEDIQLEVSADAALKRVKADRGQVEQVIMNLAVNARDAMPGGGRLTIETANVTLDQAFAQQHPPIPAADYVMLAVTDTGHGMSAETQARIFEPFFTTKATGKGTGLGLAMVYGIVKQSGGYIFVASQPGQGASFGIYFPPAESVEAAPSLPVSRRPAPATLSGKETVLLAEDEAPVRMLAAEFLESQGYTVLEAGSGDEAVSAAARHGGDIHLLLTDVVMSGMSGAQLAERLSASRPGLRVIYMSGYADRQSMQPGGPFLPKPFTRSDLLLKVRETLDNAECAAPVAK